MKIGYARTSTLEQEAGLSAQLPDLKAESCEKIFHEQVSSVDAQRPQLEAMIEFAREGDTVICTKLDRLARSVAGMVEIAERLKRKGVSILILDPHLSNRTAAEELTFNLLTAIAQFERRIMLERQREGIAKAKADGKYKGRKPTARAKAEEVFKLKAEGVGPTEIAKRLGIGRKSVYRILETPRKSV
jgi:DNA invertase Pin-like site-specific DNA recombinase